MQEEYDHPKVEEKEVLIESGNSSHFSHISLSNLLIQRLGLYRRGLTRGLV